MTLSKRLFGIVVSIAMVASLQIPGLALAEGGSAGAAAQPGGDTGNTAIQLQAVTAQGLGDVSLAAWDGVTATEWTHGSGTEEDPYLIESAENLAYLRDQVNSGQAANSTNLGEYSGVYFKQTSDIDLGGITWVPIGIYSIYATARAFSGHYDGGGHTISGLKVDQACATGSASTVGTGAGLFAFTKGGADVRASIKGLVVEGSVNQTASGNYYIAGLVGNASYTDIANCGNEASISNAGQPTAGIVGNCSYSTVDGCFNHGTIASTYQSTSYAAGIAGQAPNNANFTTSISNCYNTGNVSSSYYAGGIVSQLYCNSTSSAHTLENCYNVGTITTTTTGSNAGIAGGIVGYISAGNENYAHAQTMTNCFTLANAAPVALIGSNQTTYMAITNSGERSDDYMQSSSFVSDLGSKFISGATYPALYWEAPEGIPEITGQPESAAYVKGATPTALSVTATGDAANGELVYQWYKASSEDLSDAAAINGANASTLMPSTDAIGDTYYYCMVHNNVQALDGSGPYMIQSNAAHVQVWSGAVAVAPTITSQPQSIASIGQTETVGNDLSVAASFAGADETDSNCELSYQWQVSDSENGTYVDVDGATSATFPAPTDKVGTKYYRCVVTNTREKQSSASATSAVASVKVVGLEISTLEQLKSFAAAVDAGQTFDNCTVTVTDDITVTGAWNPIGEGAGNQTTWKPFNGEFDGGNHTITFDADDDSAGYYALFGNAGAGANIHNFVVAGAVKSSGTAVAGVVAQVSGDTVLQCVGNEASVTSGPVSYVTIACNTAGLVGIVSNGSLTVDACYNKGAITGESNRIGGLVGNATATAGKAITAPLITSSYNTGEVQSIGSGSISSGIGGIYGIGTGNGVAPIIKNCYNIGKVSAPNSTKATATGALCGSSSLSGDADPSDDDVDYYLDSSSDGRGRAGTGEQPTGYVSKTEENFKDETSGDGVLALLNNATYADKWVAGSTLDPAQASPILYWEAPEPTKYKVTFVDEDGTTVLKEAEYAEGTEAASVELPDTPTKPATAEFTYTFDKWIDASDSSVEGVQSVTREATYKATYTAAKNSYDVTFDADGGSAVDKQTVEYGKTATKPADPTKDGFEFVEWQKDGAVFDFATVVTGAVELKAAWKEKAQDSSGSSDSKPSADTASGSSASPKSEAAEPAKNAAAAVQEASPAQAATATQTAATTPANVSTVAPTLKASKVTGKSIKLAWGKVDGAASYVLYGNKCGSKNKLKMIATVNGTSYKVVKAAGKKLKKGTYYKFKVYACDADGNVIGKTLLTHVATSGGKYCNIKKVTTKAKKNKVSLKVGKSFKLGAKQVRESQKLKFAKHVGLRYATSDKTVATVSKAGKIKAKGAGTCYVYATAQNGVYAKVKVTVK